MNLRQIPNQESVLLDTNVLFYANQKLSPQCVQLVDRCARKELYGILPVHILAELMHLLMIAEARDAGWISGPNPSKKLSEQPHRIRSLSRYESSVRDLVSAGPILEPLHKEDFLTAIGLQRQYGLMTNDALLLAVGERMRVTNLISADVGFKEIKTFTLYSPDDLETR